MWLPKLLSRRDPSPGRGVAVRPRQTPKFGPRAVEALEGRALLSTAALRLRHPRTTFMQTNLVSDGAVKAQLTDPNLSNPWGLASSSSSPWWIADNNKGVTTVYSVSTTSPTTVKLVKPGGGPTITIPPPAGVTTSAPTGLVFNSDTNTNDFLVNGAGTTAHFIFATENGTIAAWHSGGSAVTMADNSSVPSAANGAVYKGLAMGTAGSATYLYATNFRAGTVDVFDSSFHSHTFSTSQFTDPKLTAHGYAPFGIQNIDGFLFVTYARQDAARHDDVAGRGLGAVDVYTTSGDLIERVAAHGTLNAPWGLAVAPSSFGSFAGDLLVGNFGDGRINAYRLLSNGRFQFAGQLTNAQGRPIAINSLWALAPGNGGSGGPTSDLFFTAGINNEANGLFGVLSPNATATG